MTDTKGARTTARLVESMLELIQVHGYNGAGINYVLAHANAPKGSLYFHFPEGKETLGEKAVELATARFRALVANATGTPAEVVRGVLDELAAMLTSSDYRLGCPVSVVTLEMAAHSDRLRAACSKAFETWTASLIDLLVEHGHQPNAAHTLATATVGMVEGAVIISRAQQSVTPLRCAADAAEKLLARP